MRKMTAIAILNVTVLMLPLAVIAQLPTPAPSTQTQIVAKESVIDSLERQIIQFEKDIADRRTRQKTLANEIAILNARINKAQLEIQRLTLVIQKLASEIAVREKGIAASESDIKHLKGIIASDLATLAQEERTPTLLLFAADGRFSDFLSKLQALETLESLLFDVLNAVIAKKIGLQEEREKLASEKEENVQLKIVQETTKISLEATSREKQRLVTVTKGEEKKFQELVKTSKADIERLKNEIYYLQRIGVTAEQAATLGVLVADRIGIRAAFLIAILEIESRMGANVGTGNYLSDMHPRDHEAFLAICKELGRDPLKTPVSKKPSYGWGGAMGPAQFLPTTWLGYKERVAFYSGHNPPSPWNIEDAFFAAALKLAKDGASSKAQAGELAAAKAYIGGSPYCSKSICTYYANLAIEKAADIERTLQ